MRKAHCQHTMTSIVICDFKLKELYSLFFAFWWHGLLILSFDILCTELRRWQFVTLRQSTQNLVLDLGRIKSKQIFPSNLESAPISTCNSLRLVCQLPESILLFRAMVVRCRCTLRSHPFGDSPAIHSQLFDFISGPSVRGRCLSHGRDRMALQLLYRRVIILQDSLGLCKF